jgi:hypothetical protein
MQLPPDSVIEERLVKTFPNTRLLSLVVSRTLRELFIEIIERIAVTTPPRRRCCLGNGGHGRSDAEATEYFAESRRDSATSRRAWLNHY